jgi:hypothetical protein
MPSHSIRSLPGTRKGRSRYQGHRRDLHICSGGCGVVAEEQQITNEVKEMFDLTAILQLLTLILLAVGGFTLHLLKTGAEAALKTSAEEAAKATVKELNWAKKLA